MSEAEEKAPLRFQRGHILVALTAVVARFAYLLKFHKNPFFDYYPRGFDQLLMLRGALEIASGNILGPLSSEKHAVIYKYIVAIPLIIFGQNFWAVWAFQFALGVVTALLVYATARRIFGQTAGMVAGLWYACYGPAIFFEGQILREPLFTLFLVLSAYLFVGIREKRSRIVTSALALSLAMQTRPTAVLIIPFALAYIWFFAYEDTGKRERLVAVSKFLATFVVVSIPLLIRSIWVHDGRFIFFDESGPFVFLLSNISDYAGVGWQPSPLYQLFVTRVGGELAMTWLQVLHRLGELYSGNPMALPELYLRKLFYSFNAYEYPSNLNYYLFLKLSPLLRAPWSLFNVVTGIGLAGFFAGFWGLREQKGRAALYLLFCGVLVGMLIFYPVDRFRLPLAPFLMIFGAFGITKFVELARKRSFIKALLMLVVALCASYMLKIPKAIPTLIRPVDFRNMGRAYTENPTHRDLGKAEFYAVKAWNGFAPYGFTMNPAGKLLGIIERELALGDVKAGDYQSVFDRLERAKAADLCNSDTYKLLGIVLSDLGRMDEAREVEREAAMLKETLPSEKHVALAINFLSRNDLETGYCHLLAASAGSGDVEFQKEMGARILEILAKIETKTLKEPPQPPEY